MPNKIIRTFFFQKGISSFVDKTVDNRITGSLPYEVKRQYLQLYNIVDTSSANIQYT